MKGKQNGLKVFPKNDYHIQLTGKYVVLVPKIKRAKKKKARKVARAV